MLGHEQASHQLLLLPQCIGEATAAAAHADAEALSGGGEPCRQAPLEGLDTCHEAVGGARRGPCGCVLVVELGLHITTGVARKSMKRIEVQSV